MVFSGWTSMGSCFSYCCREVKPSRHIKQTKYFDSTSLVEFENLIDEQPSIEPKSISSWLSFKKGKLAFQEESLELEEEAAIEARREAAKVARLAQGQELIHPARLVTKNTCWLGDDPDNWTIAGDDEVLNMTVVQKEQCKTYYYPNIQDKRLIRRDTINSSPHSSLDLEWENEAGLTPPMQCASVTDDEFISMAITDTASNHSTPISNENDLEWDGDFTSVQMTEIDTETEQLISEIEQMTAEALREPTIMR